MRINRAGRISSTHTLALARGLNPYPRGLQRPVGVQDAGADVHQRLVALGQVDVGDVLAEVAPAQGHHGDLVPQQGRLRLLVGVAIGRPHDQQSCLPEGEIQDIKGKHTVTTTVSFDLDRGLTVS